MSAQHSDISSLQMYVTTLQRVRNLQVFKLIQKKDE